MSDEQELARDKTQESALFAQQSTEVSESQDSSRSLTPSSRTGDFLDGSVVGGYRILRKVGQGGMGAVYEAEHSALRKRVAIKSLLPELCSKPETRARFLREGRSASKVRHPNVVDVYDVGEQDATPYLVMEYLEGQSLRAPLERGECLSVQDTSDILIAVLSALGAAHDQGVIHRDLKPDNVFLCTSRGGHIEPKIVDFGISKVISEQAQGQSILTRTTAVIGSPYYMSPEQAKNAKGIDGRSDQYSAAVMAYEAVTGRPPFQAGSLYDLMSEIVSGERISPAHFVPDLPDGFCEAILRAMSSDAESRFPTVTAFAYALLPYASERIRTLYGPELNPSISPPGFAISSKPVVINSRSNTGSRTPVLPAEPSSGNKFQYLLIGLSLLVLGGIAVARFGSKQPVQQATSEAVVHSAPMATQLPTSTAVVPSALPVKPSRMLRTNPASAEVYGNGALMGTTPLPLVFSSDSDELSLELRAPGYQSLKTTVTAKDGSELVLDLKPLRKAGPKVNAPQLAPR